VARLLVLLLTVLVTATACGGGSGVRGAVSLDPPTVGACRMLTGTQAGEPSNDTATVPCSEPHDVETFAVGSLPASFAKASWSDPALDRWAYTTCAEAFPSYLGTDESTAMRSLLTWVWFRPSKDAWGQGARWYRCDVLGGSAAHGKYVDLPTTTKDLLRRPDDHWMACAKGKSVATGTKLPCSMAHDWRAVTTIKLGEPGDDYPGDAAAKAKTKSYCAESVDAWLGYPADYDYGYTWFGKQAWQAGNRRSVCWARTDR
jgi:hypothetical protein